MGTSVYPGALDNFSESSPSYMADPDATGRTHAGRHDDVESAVENTQAALGVNVGNVTRAVTVGIGLWTGTQAQYDALPVKDATVVYVVT